MQLIKLSLFSLILYGGLQIPNLTPEAPKQSTAQFKIIEVGKIEASAPSEPESQPLKETVVTEPTPQEYAHNKVVERWDESNWEDFNKLVHKESGWRTDAENPSSGAYGIPQCLPVSKCIADYPDFKTNPISQIDWMLDYIDQRYGSPTQALNFHYARNWY